MKELTFDIDNRPAQVIAVDNVHVFILCPYCGMVHLHGSGKSLEGSHGPNYWGSRNAHCTINAPGWTHTSYELVGDEFTLRDAKILNKIKTKKGVLKAWYRRIQLAYV